MLADASFVLVEVVACLALAVLVLWTLTKLLGYVASAFEGEPLLATVRGDIEMTRREIRRRRRKAHPRKRPRADAGTTMPDAG